MDVYEVSCALDNLMCKKLVKTGLGFDLYNYYFVICLGLDLLYNYYFVIFLGLDLDNYYFGYLLLTYF